MKYNNWTNGNLAVDPRAAERFRSKILEIQNPPQTKKVSSRKGKSCEVDPFEIDEVKLMLNRFVEKNCWTHYLLFTIGINMARRCGDTLQLRWRNFFNPVTGQIRDDMEAINEEKTDKLAHPHINKAVREAIKLYCEKTGCEPSKNNYEGFVFLQLTGTHKGNVLTEDGYLKALKRTAAEVGITKNIGTHSARKTFGKFSRMIHPGDYDSMQLLQEIYNHSDTKVTNRYIGITKEKINQYYDDMGDFFTDYVTGDKEYHQIAEKPIVSLDANDLRDIVKAAYEAGLNNADATDAMVHVNAINELIGMIENLQK